MHSIKKNLKQNKSNNQLAGKKCLLISNYKMIQQDDQTMYQPVNFDSIYLSHLLPKILLQPLGVHCTLCCFPFPNINRQLLPVTGNALSVRIVKLITRYDDKLVETEHSYYSNDVPSQECIIYIRIRGCVMNLLVAKKNENKINVFSIKFTLFQ